MMFARSLKVYSLLFLGRPVRGVPPGGSLPGASGTGRRGIRYFFIGFGQYESAIAGGSAGRRGGGHPAAGGGHLAAGGGHPAAVHIRPTSREMKLKILYFLFFFSSPTRGKRVS